MRIITERRIREYMREHADARRSLEAWVKAVRGARWRSIDELHRTFPQADGLTVASKRTVTVFNIRGNNYRLITAVHYNRQRVYVLRFLTHAEYDRNSWKGEL